MSLRVWLPLTKDLSNQGLSGASVTNSGATLNSSGKLGGCYYFNGSAQYLQLSQTFNIFKNDFSYAVWLKPADSTRSIIISDYASSGGSNVAFELTANRNIRLYWNGSPDIYPSNCNLPLDTWTHTVIVKTTNKVEFYVNGTLAYTYTGTLVDRTTTSTLRIGDDYRGGTSVSYMGYMNDVRIYDHALSAKEVKELSKGLVAHYKLSDPYIESTTNLCNVQYLSASGTGAWGGHTSTRITAPCVNAPMPLDGCNQIDITYTGSGGGGAGYAIQQNIPVSASTTYTYSCYIKSSVGYATRSVANLLYRYELDSSGTRVKEAGAFNASQMTPLGDGWYRCWGTFTTHSATAKINLYFYAYPDQNAQYCITGWQFEQKDHMTPYAGVGGTRNELQVYDSSGYNNHCNIEGTLSGNSNTPRNSISTYFTSPAGAFAYLNITLPQFTFSFWVKHTIANRMLMGSNASLDSTNNKWYWYGDNSFKYDGGEFYYEHNAGSAESLFGTWIHFVATYDGSTIKIYRNGISEGSKSVTGNKVLEYLSLGNGYTSSYRENGYLSDFRLYATALSQEDIQELYNAPVSVANTGTMLTQGEFVEAAT